jgi:membrane fusion protein, multidrug efflux system
MASTSFSMTTSKVLIAVPVTLTLMLTGCNRHAADPPKHSPPTLTVQVAQPKRGPITRSVTLPAIVKADQQVTLYAKVAGYVKSIKVDRGDAVKEGDLIAEIEAPELLADQAKFKADVEIAKMDLQRMTDAQKKAPDLVVPLTVDSARGKYEVALASFKRNETLLTYTKIVAPFAGTIAKRWVDIGALIPAATGNSSPQSAAVATLVNASSVRIEVAVPAPEAPLIKREADAEIRVDELPNKSFKGKVTRFSDSLDDSTKTMATEILLPNSDRELRPGMFATAKIAVDHRKDALLIPIDALVVEKAKTSVFILNGAAAKKLPVKVGFEDGKSVEIIEGITEQQTVILTGKLPLSDGQAVKIAEAK